MAKLPGGVVFGDVGIGQPQLAILDHRIAFGDVGLANPHRLDLGPHQNDAAFDVILDGVIIPGPPVFSDDFVILVLRFFGHDPDQIGIAPDPVQSGDTPPQSARQGRPRNPVTKNG